MRPAPPIGGAFLWPVQPSFVATYNRLTLAEVSSPMSDTLAELKRKASQLSDAERAELALSLIESLGPADPDVEEAWPLEIERRIGQIDRGEVQLIRGDEVFARLRRRLG
jgi:putative addiction module component (TIGR02574 family)